MSESEKYTPPKETAGDHAHTLARAGISSIPVIGSAANEFFQAILAPPLRKRQAEWMNDVAEGLRQLEDACKCVVDELGQNETFIDTVMQASQAAMRTAKQEKREALRNAVLNAALPKPPDESKQAMFVQFVDMLTVWHIRLLKLFADPLPWFHRNKKKAPEFHIVGNLTAMIVAAFPELQGQAEFIEQCVLDLQGRGLLSRFQFHTNMSGQGIYEQRSTRLGREFLAFISAP